MASISHHPQRLYDYFDKYTFICEMYDEDADIIRTLMLQFYPFDNSVQVCDAKRGKTLLRRVQLPSVTIQKLQIGNIINVFSKLLFITDCVPATRKTLFHNVQSTFAMIKPTPPSLHGKIITFIMQNGFRIVRMKNAKISKEFAMQLYNHVSQGLALIIDYVTSGEVIGLELVAPDAVQKWRKCLGATDPKDAAANTLRGLYGENILKNVAHGCNSIEEAKLNCEYFFGYENGAPKIPYRATLKDCTCCIIKPHAIIDGNVGQIFEQISSCDKFYISAMAMFSVKLTDSAEFYEVYKGVVPEYESMCIHLAEGKCIVLEVKCKDPNLNCVCEFRKLCGPRDPLYDYFDKYTFICEMYDEDADIIRTLMLQFYPFDNSVQVCDAKRGKTLLRRVQLPSVTIQKLQIGNIINVFSKLLFITDCVPATRKTLFHNVQSTFAMIKPTPPSLHGKIITFIMQNGFRIVRMKNAKISKEFAMQLYSHVSQGLALIIDYVTSGEVIGLELVAPDAVQKWRKCLGATDPKDAAANTLRGLYGENILKNVAHGCNSIEEAKLNCEYFFGYENGAPKIPYRATLKDCTCCIIKPHAIIDGNVGQIFEQISSCDKFYISAMAMFSVKLTDSAEFYEVYKGVVPEYESMCIHLAEGKCIVLEVKCKDPNLNCVCEFRKLCGPRDPEMCRQLYPDCIRALYGKNIIHNAVHCTDLPEDGELEVEYFFKLLAYTS